jgi:hypothetical protein
MGAPKDLGSPAPMVLLVAVHIATLLGWLCSLTTASLEEFHIPGISNFLGFPLQLWLHPQLNASMRGCLHRLQRSNELPGLLGSPLKSQGMLPRPLNSWTMHSWKTSIKWTTPRSVTSTSCTDACSNHSCSGLSALMAKHEKGISGKQYPRWSCASQTDAPRVSSQRSLWNDFTLPLGLWWVGSYFPYKIN